MKKLLYLLLLAGSYISISAMEPEEESKQPISHDIKQFILETPTQTTLGYDPLRNSEKQLPWDYLNACNVLENSASSTAEVKNALNILELLARHYGYAPAQHTLASFIIHDQFNYKSRCKDPKKTAMDFLFSACMNNEYPPAQYLLSALLLQNSMREITLASNSAFQFKPTQQDAPPFSSLAVGLAATPTGRTFKPQIVTNPELTLHSSSAFRPIKETTEKQTKKLSDTQEFINACLLTHLRRNFKGFIELIIEKLKAQKPADSSTHELVTALFDSGVFENLNNLKQFQTAFYACGLLCDFISKLPIDLRSALPVTSAGLNLKAKYPWLEKACDYYLQARDYEPAQLRYAEIKLTTEIPHQASAVAALRSVIIESIEPKEQEAAFSLLKEQASRFSNIEAAMALLELHTDQSFENYEQIILILSRICRGEYKMDLQYFAESPACAALSSYARKKNNYLICFLLGKCFTPYLVQDDANFSNYKALTQEWLLTAAPHDSAAWWYLAHFLLNWNEDLLPLIKNHQPSFLLPKKNGNTRQQEVFKELKQRALYDGKAAYLMYLILGKTSSQAAGCHAKASTLGFWLASDEIAREASATGNFLVVAKHILPYLSASNKNSDTAQQASLLLEGIESKNLSTDTLYLLANYFFELDLAKAHFYFTAAEERLKGSNYTNQGQLVRTLGVYDKIVSLTAHHNDARTTLCLLHWERAQRAQQDTDYLEGTKIRELEKVLELLGTISENQPVDINEVLFMLGLEYEKQKHYAQAVETYRKAEGHLPAMLQLGQLLVQDVARRGKTQESLKEEGLQLLERVANYQNGEDTKELRCKAASLLGPLYLETAKSAQGTMAASGTSCTGDGYHQYREKAIGYLKQAATLENANAQKILAQLKKEQEYLTVEDALLELAENAANGDPLASYKIGLTYYQNKSYAEATTYFRKALASDPDFQIAKGYLADSLFKTDLDQEKALKEAFPLLKEFLTFATATRKNFKMASKKVVDGALANLARYLDREDVDITEITGDRSIAYFATLCYFRIFLITKNDEYLRRGNEILVNIETVTGTGVEGDDETTGDAIYFERNPIILEVFNLAETITQRNSLHEFTYTLSLLHKMRYECEVSLFENLAEHLNRALSLLDTAQKTGNTLSEDIADTYVNIGMHYLYTLRNPAEAFRCFSQAEQINPKNFEATFLLGLVYVNNTEVTDKPNEPGYGFSKIMAAADGGYAPACYHAATKILLLSKRSPLGYVYLDKAVKQNYTKALLLRIKLYLEKNDAESRHKAQQLIERILAKGKHLDLKKVQETQHHILLLYKAAENLEQKTKCCLYQVQLALKEIAFRRDLSKNIASASLWLNKVIDHAIERKVTFENETSLIQLITEVQTKLTALAAENSEISSVAQTSLERLSQKIIEKNITLPTQ